MLTRAKRALRLESAAAASAEEATSADRYGPQNIWHAQMGGQMQTVDSQLHLWGANSALRPWPAGREGEAQRPYPVTKEALLLQMDLANVSRAVLVPPSWEGDRNDLALEAAQQYPQRFAVMGRFALQDQANRDRVAGWKQQPGMLGMRFTFHNEHNRYLLTDGSAEWLWAAAEQHGIPVMVLAPGSMQALAQVAKRYPGLKMVIDHAGLPVNQRAPLALEDLPAVLALAKCPNVAIKASGLPSLSTQPFPFADLHETAQRLFDAFGPRRTFWGTDLSRMPCTYRECIDMFTRSLPWLKGEDLQWVMGRGVCEWLGWKL
jgi:L-fuconolactonase